jgi:uncharacterized membrane protein
MKRFAILLVALGSALMLISAGCGSSGGGGAVNTNPAFTRAADLAAPAGTTPAFSAAVAIDEGAATAADPAIAVGAADDGAGTLRAVAWSIVDNGTAVLSTPTVLTTPGGGYSRANGVNNAGVIVGEMGSPILPASWRSSALAGTPLPLGTGVTGAAYDINAAGRIVGETFDALGVSTAVTWASDNGVVSAPPITLAAPAGARSSSAYAVKDATGVVEIVGEFTDAQGIARAVVWRGDNTAAVAAIPLPGLPTATPALTGASIALSIGPDGTIVGEITDVDNFVHAVRWIKGAGTTYTVQNMGLGTANAINAGGRSVGAMVVPAPAISGAGAWGPGGVTPVLMHADLADGQGSAIADTGRAVGIKSTGRAYVAMP